MAKIYDFVKTDSKYKKYQTMLENGTPVGAVMQKMLSDKIIDKKTSFDDTDFGPSADAMAAKGGSEALGATEQDAEDNSTKPLSNQEKAKMLGLQMTKDRSLEDSALLAQLIARSKIVSTAPTGTGGGDSKALEVDSSALEAMNKRNAIEAERAKKLKQEAEAASDAAWKAQREAQKAGKPAVPAKPVVLPRAAPAITKKEDTSLATTQTVAKKTDASLVRPPVAAPSAPKTTQKSDTGSSELAQALARRQKASEESGASLPLAPKPVTAQTFSKPAATAIPKKEKTNVGSELEERLKKRRAASEPDDKKPAAHALAPKPPAAMLPPKVEAPAVNSAPAARKQAPPPLAPKPLAATAKPVTESDKEPPAPTGRRPLTAKPLTATSTSAHPVEEKKEGKKFDIDELQKKFQRKDANEAAGASSSGVTAEPNAKPVINSGLKAPIVSNTTNVGGHSSSRYVMMEAAKKKAQGEQDKAKEEPPTRGGKPHPPTRSGDPKQ